MKGYPGQIIAKDKEPVAVQHIEVEVANTGDRPVQVGSHFHFFEVNKFLKFDREKAYGMRLAIPSGTTMRFESGQMYHIKLVAFEGERKVYGLNGLVNGELDNPKVKKEAFYKAKESGFF